MVIDGSVPVDVSLAVTSEPIGSVIVRIVDIGVLSFAAGIPLNVVRGLYMVAADPSAVTGNTSSVVVWSSWMIVVGDTC